MTIQETDHTRELYERFRLQWMLDHGHTLTELIDALQTLREEEPEITLQSIFEDWEFGYGFGSEIWPCYEEFLDSEYQEMENARRTKQQINGKTKHVTSKDVSR